jgi:putative transposase
MSLFNHKFRIESARKPDWDYGSNGAYFITICTQNRTHFFGEIKDHQMYVSNAGLLAQQYWMEIPDRFPYAFLDAFVVMPNHIHGIIIINKQESVDDVETRFIASNAANAAPTNAAPTNAAPTNAAPTNAAPTTQMPTITPHSDLQPEKIAGGITGNHNPMFHENIARILRWYKGRCTFEIRRDAIHRVSGSGAQNVVENVEDTNFIQQNMVLNVASGAALDAIYRVSTGNLPKFDWQERFHDHIIRHHASYLYIQNYILTNPQRWKDDKFNT